MNPAGRGQGQRTWGVAMECACPHVSIHGTATMGNGWVSMRRLVCSELDSPNSSLDRDALWVGLLDVDYGLGFVVPESGEGGRGGEEGLGHIIQRGGDRGTLDKHRVCRRNCRSDMKALFVDLETFFKTFGCYEPGGVKRKEDTG